MDGWNYTPGTGCVCCPCLTEVWLVSVGSYWGVEIGGGLFLFLERGCGSKGSSRAINAVFASSIASVGKRYLALVYGCLFFLCCGLMERGWGGGACLLRTLEMGFSLRRLGQR